MSEQSYSLAQDLNEARVMTDGLASYVLSDQLYGGIGGRGMFTGSKMPSLTIGALLMRLHRLNALRAQMTPAQQTALDEIQVQHDALRDEWRVHYTGKMLREAHSRLGMMDQYFDECSHEPSTCAGNYLPEALRRTIIQEIAQAAETLDADMVDLRRKLRRTDSHLRRYAQPSNFVWDSKLEPAYPRDEYWWLWARPEANKKK